MHVIRYHSNVIPVIIAFIVSPLTNLFTIPALHLHFSVSGLTCCWRWIVSHAYTVVVVLYWARSSDAVFTIKWSSLKFIDGHKSMNGHLPNIANCLSRIWMSSSPISTDPVYRVAPSLKQCKLYCCIPHPVFWLPLSSVCSNMQLLWNRLCALRKQTAFRMKL